MPFIIIAVFAIISFFSLSMRSYVVFNLTIIGIGGFIAGIIMKDYFILFLGLGTFLFGIAVLYLTSIRRVEPSARGHYMLYMWIYGMFLFIRTIIIGMIITLPLLSLINAATKNYSTVVLVDSQGNRVGNAVIDEYGNDAYGNHYDKYDPY